MEDKQKRYLDKVVEFLVEDTKIDYEYGFHPPFLWEASSVGGYLTKYGSPQLFREYCKDTYGLTTDESQYVWNKYSTKIIFIINNM